MGNRFAIGAIIAAVILFVIYQSAYVVNAREQALTIRFGEIQDVNKKKKLKINEEDDLKKKKERQIL